MTQTETAELVAYLKTQRSTTQDQVDTCVADRDAVRGFYVTHQAHMAPQGSRH